jgi:serine/tyrosine/threonine adenylyltransferase
MLGMEMKFDNRFVRELPGEAAPPPGVRQVEGALWSHVAPTPVRAPKLLGWTPELAAALGIAEDDVRDPAFADVFAGNRLLPGMFPYAANYGGHQFGHWAGQLGDGRAIGLGEALGRDGSRWELQLKGAGPTPYSRHADGRAVLRSSIREFLCSEAMHHLGIPTTRALCLVGTGEQVERDMFYDGHPRMEPGAVVCRAAPSFIRFGSFELPFARGDLELLRKLLDFCIDRDFPELGGEGEALFARWFGEVCERTAVLVGHWMRVGFVHGVLNTDNMSILGLTIDYGPYGWIENYDPDWTPNTTDAQGRRYRFGWQPRIAGWNLVRLAHALSPVFADPAPLQEGLQRFELAWAAAERGNAAAKLGLERYREGDLMLMQDLLALLHEGEVDMTLWFRALSDLPADIDSLDPFAHAFYDDHSRGRVEPGLLDWLRRRRARLAEDGLPEEERRARMRAANPKYVLRNWLAQRAIDRAEAGDLSELHALQEVMRRPYEDQPGRETYAAPRPEWARERAGCSMLSCSS